MADQHLPPSNHYPPFSPDWFAALWAALAIMYRVIHAVIIREARTRFGSSNIGYAWALIDPLIELTVLVVAFTAIGRSSPVPAPLAVFLITGIMPFYLWRGSVSRGANAVSANLGLLSYPQVMPADIIIARVLLEATTTIVVYILFVFAAFLVSGTPIGMFFGNPSQMLMAAAVIFYFSISSAFLSSGMARILPIWQNIWGYLSRPIWLLSGIFFTLESLPSGARAFMAYNPIAHLLEWFRSAAIPTFESGAYSPMFPISVATVFLVIGLVIDRILLMTGDEEIVS